MTIPIPIRRFFEEHRAAILSVSLLVCSLVITHRYASSPSLLGLGAVLFASALVPVGNLSADASYLARFRAHAAQIVCVAMVVLALRLWDPITVPSLAFLYVWLGLMAIGQSANLCRRALRKSVAEFSSLLPFRARERVLGESLLVMAAFYMAGSFYPHFWPDYLVPLAAIAIWTALQIAANGLRTARTFASNLLRIFGSLLILAVLMRWMHRESNAPVATADLTFTFWLLASLMIYYTIIYYHSGGLTRAALYRWMLLGLVGFFLLRGLATFQLHGTPDALWYGTMLADMVEQMRHGTFPVWIGQSIYQFNGSIYPLRVAPSFQHYGALLEILTFHSLGIFALQNLLLTVFGLSALFTCYLTLALLLPRRRWLAAALASLFLSCPGVLGIVYNTDLYMSWTTLPFVPLSVYAAVQSFRDAGSRRTMGLLGFALAACWWGHTPIALWITLVVGATQLVRIIIQRFSLHSLLNALVGGAIFIAIAGYPIGSVLFFPPEKSINAASFQIASPGTIVHFIREVFPAVLLPVSTKGRALSDFQLGWSLWGLVVVTLLSWRRLSVVSRCLALGATMLAILLTPVPGLDLRLWSIVPAFVRNTTGNWVMNRLYLILSTITLFAFAASADAILENFRKYKTASFLLLGAVSWSITEATAFGYGSSLSVRDPGAYINSLRAENIQLTRFAYLVFPNLPSWFTHGVMDPVLEQQIYSADFKAIISTNLTAAARMATPGQRYDFVAPARQPSAFIELDRPVHLEFNHHYLLELAVVGALKAEGVLQFTGKTFFREYALPAYGGNRSFGVGGEHRAQLSIWTTVPRGEDVSVRFFPSAAASDSRVILPFGSMLLLEYDPSLLPIQVQQWIPYTVALRSPAAGWLETPRMYQDAYQAKVDGASALIRKSPEGLVAIQIPAGASQVELQYIPPLALSFCYWFALATMVAFPLWFLIQRRKVHQLH